MVGRRNDLKHLVVQLADVLGAADIGRAGYGFVGTDVQAAARASSGVRTPITVSGATVGISLL